MMPKKTLLVTLDYPPAIGGVSASWERLAVASKSFLTVLTVPNESSSPNRDRATVLRRPLLFRDLWPRWLRAIFVVFQSYRSSGAQQLIAGQILPIGTVAWLLSLFFGFPYFVQVYGMDLVWAAKSKRKTWLVKRILSRAKGVLANSQATADLIKTLFDVQVKALTIVYPIPENIGQHDGAMVQKIRLSSHLEGKKVVLTVGRLVKRKGHRQVIEAMKKIWEKEAQLVYVVVGDGPEKNNLEGLAKGESKIIFAGAVSKEVLSAWYALCDIFIMPSLSDDNDFEGFGMVYLEAAQFGKPVIGSKNGGASEAIEDGKTGILVDPENEAEIVQVLSMLLKDDDLRKRLGENARKRLENDFSFDAQLKKFQKALL